MENEDDFTFCQVNSPVNLDMFETQKSVPDVSSISLKDAPTKETGTHQNSGVWSKDNSPSTNTTPKQETIGSLTFNVINTSSSKQLGYPPQQATSQDTGSSMKASQEPKTKVKKPVPRAKVPFEKGYSQMDWLKLTRTHPDLAGLKGQSNKRLISLKEVKLHQTEGSMWTVLKGRVYNIAPYMKFHPGGVDLLMKAVGKDCTTLFNKYHAWVNAEFLLEKCLVGILDDSQ